MDLVWYNHFVNLSKKILIFFVGIILVLFVFIFLQKKNIEQSAPSISKIDLGQNNVPSQSAEESPRTEIIAENLDTPWAITFLPDENMLVTERLGKIYLIEKNGGIKNVEFSLQNSVREIGEGGLMGIVSHPEFTANKFVYIYYTYSGEGNNTLNRVSRLKLEGMRLLDEKIIVDEIPGASNHNGGRIKFGPDKLLYITTGDSQDPSLSQDRNSLAGKILRVAPDGSIPPDNPFGNLTFSYGHRNPQGITWSGNSLYETEHGPSGVWPNCCQDELNRIEKGVNYGWPQSVGDRVSNGTTRPLRHSGRDIWAPAGATFIGDSLFFAGLRGSTLYEAVIKNNQVIELKEHFKGELGRLREVIAGPDGMLYISTSNRDGRGAPKDKDDKIIRVNPSKL